MNYKQNIAAWRAKTSAEVHSPHSFASLKTKEGFHLLGVMGFAGPWEKGGLDAKELKVFLASLRRELRDLLCGAKTASGDSLIMVSGATNQGVLAVAYELARELLVATMGIAPDRSLNFDLAAMDFMLPIGKRFGEESETFVSLCDQFVLVGGGAQARREAIAARDADKPVTVVQGFGGVADEFFADNLPGARFITRRTM